MADLNPIRYRGYYYDKETQLYYLQTRYYDPATGRFISPDTVEHLDPETIHGLNLYAYGLNNPVMYVDPTGHFVLLALVIAATVNDIYQLTRSDEEERVSAKRNGNSVEVSNSHKILTPWVKWGYGFYLNHVNDETKDVIQGTTSGLVGEWEAHNLAYYGLSALNVGLSLIDESVPDIPKLMDRASPLNLEGTVFDNDEPIIKAGLVIYNVITRPVATVIDFLVHIGWL